MSEDKTSKPQHTNSTSGGPERGPLQLASIVAGWAGLAAIVVGLLWAAVIKSFSVAPLVLVMGGAALVIFWLIINIATVAAAAKSRQAKLILNSVLFTALILGIVVLVNYVGARHHVRKDLTQSKQYSLSEQTRAVAQALEQEVKLIAFVSLDYHNWGEIDDRLREYEMLSPKIKVERYDPKTDFSKAKEHDVQFDGTVMVESSGKTERVTGASEEQLTSAILAVTSGEKTKVYFLTGHGELPLTGSQQSVATLKANLENQQYEVETLSLMAMEQPQVPQDCAVLGIIGAKRPLDEKEVNAISAYLTFGGKLIAAIDPPPAPNLEEILIDYGIIPLDGIVLDPQLSLWGQSNVPMVNAPPSHEITRNLGAVILPVTRAFELGSPGQESEYPGAPSPTPSATALLESSSSAWLEISINEQAQRDTDERSGPLVMAALVDQTTPPPPMMPGMAPPPREDGVRMVVVGTSIMMSDDLVRQGVDIGVYFALKSIAWLVENEKLISIPPKDTTPNYITFSDRQRNAAIVAVFGLPVLVMLTGVTVWWRRRRG